jgi:voltage-gated potassium channel
MTGSIQRVLWAVGVLTLILVGGTIGLMIAERWTVLEAIWMTVITMSTVGFGEVRPLDPTGRILTMLIILSTLLVGGYAVGNIGAFFIGGEVRKIIRGRRLERDISRLSGHIVLTAYGRVGREAAIGLPNDKILVVDSDPAALAEARDSGFLTLEGDATHESVLKIAGVERARAMIVATGSVADNILICLTARDLNPNIFIAARGDDPGSESKLKRSGANRVVMPNQIGGRRLAAFLRHPAVMDFLDLVTHGDDLALQLQEIQVAKKCPLIGKTLGESDLRKESGGSLVMAIKQPGGELIVAPPPGYQLAAGDLLIVLGTDQSLAVVCRMLGN